MRSRGACCALLLAVLGPRLALAGELGKWVAVLDIDAPEAPRASVARLPGIIEQVAGTHDGYAALPDGNAYRARVKASEAPGCQADDGCRKKVAKSLGADLIVSGMLDRDGERYVLTLALESAGPGAPQTTSESMKSLRSLRRNVELCLGRLIPLVAAGEAPAPSPDAGEPAPAEATPAPVTPESAPTPSPDEGEPMPAPTPDAGEPAPAEATPGPTTPEEPASAQSPDAGEPTPAPSPEPVEKEPEDTLHSFVVTESSDVSESAQPVDSTPSTVAVEDPPERRLGLKASINAGAVLFDTPGNGWSAVRFATAVSVSWAPGRLPGEIGLSVVLDDGDLLSVRADLRYFLYKGPVFSHYVGIDGAFVRFAQGSFGGGGMTLGFEWQVWRYLAIVWTLGADFLVSPTSDATSLPPGVVTIGLPGASGIVLPMSLLGLQARF